MIARARCKSASAANPDRAAGGTGARAASALLLPGLGAAATNVRTVLLTLRTGTTARAMRGNDLVNQRFVEVCAKGYLLEAFFFERVLKPFARIPLRERGCPPEDFPSPPPIG